MKANGQRHDEKGSNKKKVSDAATPASGLSDLHITRDQSSQWQQLAEVPEAEFERRVTDRATTPTTEGIIYATQPKDGSKPMQMDRKALWLWGCLNEFEKTAFSTDR
jgi:hypothetical protein